MNKVTDAQRAQLVTVAESTAPAEIPDPDEEYGRARRIAFEEWRGRVMTHSGVSAQRAGGAIYTVISRRVRASK